MKALYRRRATPSYRCAMIVASSIWLTFIDKIRGGGTFGCQFLSVPLNCAISVILDFLIGIPHHFIFTYVIIF